MRIYKVHIEHKRFGRNWSSSKVEGKTFDEAVKKAKRDMTKQERIESVELLASTD
jgi:hypothetical protein